MEVDRSCLLQFSRYLGTYLVEYGHFLKGPSYMTGAWTPRGDGSLPPAAAASFIS